MRWGTKLYFQSFINFSDFAQFFAYFSHLIINAIIINNSTLSSNSLLIANNYLEVSIIFFGIIKILELLSSFRDFQMLVILIEQVINKLIPLLIVYIMFIIEFSVMLLAASG